MTYTHTSVVLPCEVDTFCADCENPLSKGSPARRRVTNINAPAFREEWICGGTCGPIIDVSDDTLMRKRIAALEQELNEAQQERDEIDVKLAAERAAHQQTAANLNAQLTPARGPRAHIVLGEDQ